MKGDMDCGDCAWEKGVDLTSRNTLGLESRADAVCCVSTQADLESLSRSMTTCPRKLWILGGGSNVVLPEHLQGLVVCPVMKGIELLENTQSHILLRVQAGESWHEMVSHCVGQSWGGLENLALIPGSVGAAPIQNIGAYGIELSDVLYEVQAWDVHLGHFKTFSKDMCRLEYRSSWFKQQSQGRWIITAVTLRCSKPWIPNIEYTGVRDQINHLLAHGGLRPHDVFEAICKLRSAKLPDWHEFGNVGSFFKNPTVNDTKFCSLQHRHPCLHGFPHQNSAYKISAAWLIDQGGWKGRRVGPVGIHQDHALVLVNYGTGKAQDIKALAQAAQDDVYMRFQIRLEVEPGYW